MMMNKKRKLSPQHKEGVLQLLKARFEANMGRHQDIQWTEVAVRLEANEDKLWSLSQMEASGGEPDVIGMDEASGEYLFCDCAAESPIGRRSLCYDEKALADRKANKPAGSAVGMASAMGTTLLTEEEYRRLQTLGEFDMKTSSWIDTPESIRNRKGALFCDRRYDTVFVYHNGAESYYAGRGFRSLLRV